MVETRGRDGLIHEATSTTRMRDLRQGIDSWRRLLTWLKLESIEPKQSFDKVEKTKGGQGRLETDRVVGGLADKPR